MRWMPGPVFAPEGGSGTGGSGDGGAGGSPGGGQGADGGGGAPPAWHTGIDPTAKGFLENKGWWNDDPKVTVGKMLESYRGAESKLGVPADQLIRMPQPNAQPTDLDAFWQRLGAVKDAKDLDFSNIKSASGEPLDPKLSEAIAAAAISSRAPKDVVGALTSAVVKHLDGITAEQRAAATARTQEQTEALKKNWGPNYENNMFDAKRTFTRWATAAGLDEAKANEAIDAISRQGGVGAATVMQMLHILGQRMSESRWVEMPKPGADPALLSREAAQARMEELKADKAWVDRWSKGGVAEKAEWRKLLQVATGQSGYAA